MTKQKAKKLSLEVWRYLAEHPEPCTSHTYSTLNLPIHLYKQIKSLRNRCPLCELFFESGCVCVRCPLKRCDNDVSSYHLWSNGNMAERMEAVRRIVSAIEAWEPEEGE